MKNIFAPTVLISIIMLANSCAGPYTVSNKKYKKQAKVFARIIKEEPKDSIIADSLKLSPHWIGTTNFGMRRPNYVIIHHTAQNSCEKTLQTFTDEKTQVSAHYIICKDGTLHHMLNDYLRAWHAGAAKWGNETDINSSSIGIELDNNGVDSFSLAQVNTLLGLLSALKKNYNIPVANFIGHADIAPGRKIDPGVKFPWRYLADQGFGLWYSDTSNIIVPENFNVIYALRIIGYNTSNITAAIQAFRLHFLQTERSGELTEAEKKVLFVLMGKYL
jgi:N-acetylmuramoyl-L-alanine amidase